MREADRQDQKYFSIKGDRVRCCSEVERIGEKRGRERKRKEGTSGGKGFEGCISFPFVSSVRIWRSMPYRCYERPGSKGLRKKNGISVSISKATQLKKIDQLKREEYATLNYHTLAQPWGFQWG